MTMKRVGFAGAVVDMKNDPVRFWLPGGVAAAVLLAFLLPTWPARASNPASAREFIDGDYVLTSCTSVAAYAEGRLWETLGAAEMRTGQQLFAERAGDLPARRIGSVEELKSMLAGGEYFPEACWAAGVKGAPVPQHIPYFTFPGNGPYQIDFGPGQKAVPLHGKGYVQLFPRAFGFLWRGVSDQVASDSLAQACDTYAKDPTGEDGHRRELADPVATALAAGGWSSRDAYLAQRDAFQSYRKLVAKYRWSPSNGLVKNVAAHFKQNEILNPSDTVKNGQKTQKAASDLMFHAAAAHPELAQGEWLQSLMQLIEPGPDVPAFASLQDAQAGIAGFAGFAAPAEQQVMEQDWIAKRAAASGVYVIDKRNQFQCLGSHPALWQAIFRDLEDQAQPPHDRAQ